MKNPSTLLAILVSANVVLAGDLPAPRSPASVNDAPSSLIRNIGGIGGAIGGGVAGSMLAQKIVAHPGIAAQGPLLVKGVGVMLPVVAAVLAAKALSLVGNEGDRLIGSKTSGTIIGTAVGALGGAALLSRLAAFGGPSGKIAAAAIGAVAGGVAASLAPGPVNWATNPAILGGLTGGFFGFRGGGLVGGLAGLALGGATGFAMDRMLFARPEDRLRDAIPSMPSMPSMPRLPFASESASAMTQSVETAAAPSSHFPVEDVNIVTDDPLNADEQVRYSTWNR